MSSRRGVNRKKVKASQGEKMQKIILQRLIGGAIFVFGGYILRVEIGTTASIGVAIMIVGLLICGGFETAGGFGLRPRKKKD